MRDKNKAERTVLVSDLDQVTQPLFGHERK